MSPAGAASLSDRQETGAAFYLWHREGASISQAPKLLHYLPTTSFNRGLFLPIICKALNLMRLEKPVRVSTLEDGKPRSMHNDPNLLVDLLLEC